MIGLGRGIEKILAPFRRAILHKRVPAWADAISRGKLTVRKLDECNWESEAYPATLKKLMAHPHFDANETMADAYICGYVRGWRDAFVVLTTPDKPSKRTKVKARR